jgi:hypothetical protein
MQGAGTVAIELLSQGTIEPGESAHPQESARAKRQALGFTPDDPPKPNGADRPRRMNGQALLSVFRLAK